MTFGRWLAQRRNHARLTQEQLASKCGLSAPYIARLEAGSVEPPPRATCKALARALRLDFDEVWTRSFAARLKRWLKREGYRSIPEPELLDLLGRIQCANRGSTK